MQPVDIPEGVGFPGWKTQEIKGGQPGVADVMAQIGFTDGGVPAIAMLIRCDLEDIEHFQRDPHFWLVSFGTTLSPFALERGLQPGMPLEVPSNEKYAVLRFRKAELKALAEHLADLWPADRELNADVPLEGAAGRLCRALTVLHDREVEERMRKIAPSSGKLHVVENGHRKG